jgi:hypothetical protein
MMFCETVMVEILSLEGCSYAIYQIRIMFSETVSDEIAKNLDDTLICFFFGYICSHLETFSNNDIKLWANLE